VKLIYDFEIVYEKKKNIFTLNEYGLI